MTAHETLEADRAPFTVPVELSAQELAAIRRWADVEGLGNVPLENVLQSLFYDRLHRLMLRQLEPTQGY